MSIRPKYYIPRNQFNTPPYYPQHPVAHVENPSPVFFAKLDVDTLFYIFYYFQGTYLQCVSCHRIVSVGEGG
jgi:CCR4-NOT transcription complex subunit 3